MCPSMPDQMVHTLRYMYYTQYSQQGKPDSQQGIGCERSSSAGWRDLVSMRGADPKCRLCLEACMESRPCPRRLPV